MIRIDIDDTQVQAMLADLQRRVDNLRPAMAQIQVAKGQV